MTDLSGVDLKIKRGKSQVAYLKGAIEEACAPERQRFVFERDGQTGEHLYRAFGVPVVRPEWKVIVGEILFNLRSALDHLAWQVVLLAKGTPYKKTNFPIRDTPLDSDGNLVGANFRPPVTDANILKVLEECQPYVGINGEPHPFNHSPLWRMHHLNIIDKHRLLLVVTSVLSWDKMWWGWGGKDWGPAPGVRLNLAPLQEGDPVAWFDFHGDEPPRDFNPHPAMHVSLHESEMVDLSFHPLDRVLDTFCWWVEYNVIEWRFRPLFT
jgi:hypothetical protein